MRAFGRALIAVWIQRLRIEVCHLRAGDGVIAVAAGRGNRGRVDHLEPAEVAVRRGVRAGRPVVRGAVGDDAARPLRVVTAADRVAEHGDAIRWTDLLRRSGGAGDEARDQNDGEDSGGDRFAHAPDLLPRVYSRSILRRG